MSWSSVLDVRRCDYARKAFSSMLMIQGKALNSVFQVSQLQRHSQGKTECWACFCPATSVLQLFCTLKTDSKDTTSVDMVMFKDVKQKVCTWPCPGLLRGSHVSSSGHADAFTSQLSIFPALSNSWEDLCVSWLTKGFAASLLPLPGIRCSQLLLGNFVNVNSYITANSVFLALSSMYSFLVLPCVPAFSNKYVPTILPVLSSSSLFFNSSHAHVLTIDFLFIKVENEQTIL